MEQGLKIVPESLKKELGQKRFVVHDPILKVGERPSGLYLIPGDSLQNFFHTNSRGKENSIFLVGLKELLLDIPADQNLNVSKTCQAYHLPAEKFQNLIAEEWFAKSILQFIAHDSVFVSSDGVLNRLERLEKLVDASRIVNSTLDLDELLRIILDTALKSVDGDRGTVYLVDEESDELWSKVLEGDDHVMIRLPVGKGIAGHVAKTGETLNITDAPSDKRFNPEIDKKTGYTTKTILCMPLKNKTGKLLGVFQLLNKKNGVFTIEDEQFIEALSIHAASAIENARLYEQEKEKIAMEKEMLAAGEVQKKLFPSEIPQPKGYQVAAINIPARETSGDLYDFITLDDDKLVVALGDVSGKGLPASILMANLQSVMRDLPFHNPSPAFCVNRFNNIINRVSSSGKFITLFYSVLDVANHTLSFSNAGHEYPYLFRKEQTDRLSSGGLPVGIMPDSPYDEDKIDIHPGDTLLIFTDGVGDATNANDESFTEERLRKLVSGLSDLEPQKIIRLVCDEIKKFTGDSPQFDDITMVILRRNS